MQAADKQRAASGGTDARPLLANYRADDGASEVDEDEVVRRSSQIRRQASGAVPAEDVDSLLG